MICPSWRFSFTYVAEKRLQEHQKTLTTSFCTVCQTRSEKKGTGKLRTNRRREEFERPGANLSCQVILRLNTKSWSSYRPLLATTKALDEPNYPRCRGRPETRQARPPTDGHSYCLQRSLRSEPNTGKYWLQIGHSQKHFREASTLHSKKFEFAMPIVASGQSSLKDGEAPREFATKNLNQKARRRHLSKKTRGMKEKNGYLLEKIGARAATG